MASSGKNSGVGVEVGEGEASLITLKQGERLVGPTRRPDGTLRKPIRIRAGYVPQDEVAIYQSKGTLWKKEMESQVGPPGFDPEMAAKAVKPKSKSVKRNERKKEKRQQATVDRTQNSEQSADEDKEETDSKDSNLKQSLESAASQISQLDLSSAAIGKSSTNPAVGLDTANAGVDIDKKIRALKKKIRLAEAQLQKASPEDMKPEQLEKVKKLEGWQEELKLLEGENTTESATS